MAESASDNRAGQNVLRDLTAASAPPTPQHSISGDDDSKRYCWVCLATEDDDTEASWVQPCRCKGTTKWVHQACLQRWVDEKRKGNAWKKVACPQCNTEYLIVFPSMGVLVQTLDIIDSMIHRTCPILAATVVFGSIYWSAVTHGAVTVMMVMGCEAGLDAMENRDPYVLLIGLPVIPLALVLSKMVHWEERLLLFLRNTSPKVPFMRYLLPSFVPPPEHRHALAFPPTDPDPGCTTRLLCSALFMPGIATLVGRMLFDSVQTNWQRSLLGGVTFIAIKGALKIYLKQQQYVRDCRRQILDYTESNINLSRTQAQRFAACNPPPVPIAVQVPVYPPNSSAMNISNSGPIHSHSSRQSTV